MIVSWFGFVLHLIGSSWLCRWVLIQTGGWLFVTHQSLLPWDVISLPWSGGPVSARCCGVLEAPAASLREQHSKIRIQILPLSRSTITAVHFFLPSPLPMLCGSDQVAVADCDFIGCLLVLDEEIRNRERGRPSLPSSLSAMLSSASLPISLEGKHDTSLALYTPRKRMRGRRPCNNNLSSNNFQPCRSDSRRVDTGTLQTSSVGHISPALDHSITQPLPSDASAIQKYRREEE